MSNTISIRSHRGPYTVRFVEEVSAYLRQTDNKTVFIVDERVGRLYRKMLRSVLERPSTLVIKATEANKSLEKFPGYVRFLLSHHIRKKHRLVAIGGGIIQDITCFLAASLFRGVAWDFIPTTLLAQADSCIGSKSSINVSGLKNILGTFTPPNNILISTQFLKTLSLRDVRSGVGEMLKVHAIEGPRSFDRIAKYYSDLFTDANEMEEFIRRSLQIKKKIIEKDEFDEGLRRVMNYGHTFGHAIEAATHFRIPHGIAVTIGMDMANFIAMRLKMTGPAHYERMHMTLRLNYTDFKKARIPLAPFLKAIAKDKKSSDKMMTLILPDKSGRVSPRPCALNARFKSDCAAYLSAWNRS